MTVHIGDHIHPVAYPEIDLTVDVVGHLPDGHEVYRAHDAAGHEMYLSGEDTTTTVEVAS